MISTAAGAVVTLDLDLVKRGPAWGAVTPDALVAILTRPISHHAMAQYWRLPNACPNPVAILDLLSGKSMRDKARAAYKMQHSSPGQAATRPKAVKGCMRTSVLAPAGTSWWNHQGCKTSAPCSLQSTSLIADSECMLALCATAGEQTRTAQQTM